MARGGLRGHAALAHPTDVTSSSMRTRRRQVALVAALAIVIVGGYVAVPYARAVSLIVRAANMGGPLQAFAAQHTTPVTISPPHVVPTRYGDVAAQFYTP